MYRDGFLGHDIGNVVEILILHPNLSLRVNPDEAIDEPGQVARAA